MTRHITINGKGYTVTEDSFGNQLVNGILMDEFLDKLPPEDLNWLAQYGAKAAREDPAWFADVVDRHEMTGLEPFVDPKFRSGDDGLAR